MGLHLPGSSFVQPGDAAARRAHPRGRGRAVARTAASTTLSCPPIGEMVDEKLHRQRHAWRCSPRGGSTNHTDPPGWPIARAAGILLDLGRLSPTSRRSMPLLTRVYPNGSADVNALPRRRRHRLPDPHAARRRAAARGRRRRSCGHGLRRYTEEPVLPRRSDERADLASRPGPEPGPRRAAARLDDPFSRRRWRQGASAARCGTGVVKTSAVAVEHQRGLGTRAGLRRPGTTSCTAFADGAARRRSTWSRVHPLPGPGGQRHARAAQADPGARRSCRTAASSVAIVTDGRMSGASGKVPAAIHVTPEAAAGWSARQGAATAT